MSHIPHDVVRRLFDESPHKTWPGFRRALQEYKVGRARGIDEATIDELLELTTRMERHNETFPISADKLQEVVDRETHPVRA